MKYSNLKITIENPCNKINWTTMSDFEKGKFCSICSKSVSDFTKMTDEEIVNFLNRSEESICARLNKSQMNRILTMAKPDNIKHWNKIAATIALMTISAATYSNTFQNENIENEISIYDSSNSKQIRNNRTVHSDSIPKIIKGKVIEEDWDYPVETSISIKGTKLIFDTDSLGNFEIVIPKNFKKAELTLVVKSTGLEDDTEVNLQMSELPKYDLIITKNPMMIGEVIILKRNRWWQFWK